MQFSNVTYTGTFSGSGAGTDEGFPGTATITGPVTAVLSEAANGSITGTFSYSGTSSLFNPEFGQIGGPSFTGGGTVSGMQSGLTFTATSGPLNSGSASISSNDTTITFSDQWSISSGGLSGSGGASGSLSGSLSSSPPPPPSPPPSPTPPIINSPQDIINSGSVTNQTNTIGTDIELVSTLYGDIIDPAAQTFLGLQAANAHNPTAQLESILDSILNDTSNPETYIFETAYDTSFLPVVGPALAFAGTWATAYADFKKTGTLTGQTQTAGIKALAALASGYAGEIIGSGLAESFFVGGLTLGTAGAAPLIGGVLLGVASAYVINGVLEDIIDGGGVSGNAGTVQTEGPLFWGNAGSSAAFVSSASSAETSASVGSANPLSFAIGEIAPQPTWTYDTGTGAFTWLGASTAPLTQALSELGVTQLSAPLTITGSASGGDLLIGGPDDDHLSVGSGGSDVIIAGSGNDVITAGPGSNVVDGGAGVNVMLFTGTHSSYAMSHSSGALVVSDLRSGAPDGTDTLSGIDQMRFTYGVVDTAYDFDGDGASDLLLRNTSSGVFELYDIANNTITAAQSIGAVGLSWQIAGFGDFTGSGGTDMLMRNIATGAFEVYDIANNAITFAAGMGDVGLEWQVAGFGDFTGSGQSDMLLRNVNTGAFEFYDIANNAITTAGGMGAVGLSWQVAGFGDFASDGSTDMLMRNSATGQFEVYDIKNNQITFAAGMGAVGLSWQVVGIGDFAGNGQSDMLMRNTGTGAFEVYDIANNQITFAGGMGAVGLSWQVVEIGTFNGDLTGDMLMQNTGTGAFEVYDITNNQITLAAGMGQVGNQWTPTGPSNLPGVTTAQIAQAMAAFAPASGSTAPVSTQIDQPAPVAASSLVASNSQIPVA